MTEASVRQARPDDHDAVADFTAGTWADREMTDYVPAVFPEWVAGDGPDQRTVVATVDDHPVGLCQGVRLTADEAWLQGIRVDPAHRGEGHAAAMTAALHDWAAERGAVVARNMIFGWNDAALGAARHHGWEPGASARWVEPDPDGGARPALDVSEDVAAAWAHWTDSAARAWLDGLALDDEESWALSELTRRRLERMAADGRVLAVVDATARAMTVRAGIREEETEGGDTRRHVDYAVASWDDLDAGRSLLDAVRADAAEIGAETARVPIPETPGAVADAATARAPLSDEPFYVWRADLSDRS
jgi:GNAT superfamily N-acetyltransferase